ncbi:MAG: IS5 family transposase [Candidatus Sumerlaeia bacterium]|nr:IS5 family transposase [Candidatus Sumerlaeia bacterium]
MMANRPAYPSDLTDGQWEILQPLIPPAKHGGRPRKADMRAVVDSIFYLLRTGCQWDALPKTYPPKSTVHEYYSDWRKDGALQTMHDALRDKVRRKAGRNPQPRKRGLLRGYDAGKKVSGRKRHIMVDTMGLLLDVCITGADWRDRKASIFLFHGAGERCTELKTIFADRGYNGDLPCLLAKSFTGAVLTIVPRHPGHNTFVVLPKRWIVERTFAWIVRCRRLAKDLEYTAAPRGWFNWR